MPIRLPGIAVGVSLVATLFFCTLADARAAAPALDLDTARATVQGPTLNPVAVPADFFDDSGRPLSIDQVTTSAFQARFRTIRNADSKPPYTSGWLRFALRSRTTGQWLLILDPDYNEADLYIPDAHGGFALTRFGMLIPLDERPYGDVPYPAVPVSANMVNGRLLYLHFSAHGAPTVGISAATRETVLKANLNAGRHSYIWIGLFIAIGMSNALLFFYLRDRAFLAYAGVMVIAILFELGVEPWMQLWPWASISVEPLNSIIIGLYFLSIALFARTFLELGKREPRLDKVVVVLGSFVFLYITFAGMEPWTLPVGFGTIGILIPDLLLCVTLLACGVLMLRRGVVAARFYIAGFAGYVAGLISVYIGFWWFPSVGTWLETLRWPLSDPNSLGIAWEALFLTFAIGDRIQTARAEAFAALTAREKALEQVSESQEQMLARLGAQNTAMERFVPRAFLQHLGRESVEELQLGDHILSEMTLLFSDIRAFTTMAESISAQEAFDFINSYLTHAGPIVRQHRGFIDKYIGDAIMALFSYAPSDALDAAIALQTEVIRYNQARARARYRAIAIGVGMHRGMLALGAIGETERIETTVIADAVNIASRMEGLTKLYGARIIASEGVVTSLEDPKRYRLRSLGRVQVVGASHDLEIFEAFDGDPPELILQKMQSLEVFADAVRAFAAGSFEEAERLFARITEESPGDRAAAHLAQRCRVLTTAGLPEAWDGVERLEAK